MSENVHTLIKCAFSKNKNILSHTCNTGISFSTFNMDTMLLFNLLSNLTKSVMSFVKLSPPWDPV